ncbi:MAG: nucleotidyltransferase domain-containing protein [Clostridiales bacterium]|nr:nucleotidyltransferase domain-containing protein [Clostridiales bacterium]
MVKSIKDVESLAIGVLREYPVKRAALFGSVARGDMTEQSDLDMIVEFMPDTRGIIFFGLYTDLEQRCGRSVDLLTFNALEHEAKGHFKENVMREMRVIYEREE